jgi:Uma2 family endonuclease
MQQRIGQFTFEEYLAYDDGTDSQYELVDSELVEMPPESDLNVNLSRFLYVALLQHFPFYLVAHKDTEMEVSGRRANCRLPDLMVHTEESKAALAGAKRATLTRDMSSPALIIEIVSPGSLNRSRDYRHKWTEYAARKVSEYWIVDPQDQIITVCQWSDGVYENKAFQGDQLLQSKVVPDFPLTVNQIFSMEC